MKQDKFDMQKALIKNAEVKYQGALREKISKQKDTLEQQRDLTKYNLVIK